MVARWFVQGVERLVSWPDLLVVVRAVLGEIVVLGTILLYQLHVLHLYGMVVLITHVVVDFVRIIWDVSDFFDV